MKKTEFRTWMKEVRGLSAHTANLRNSNCKKVEMAHGCLDQHFASDKGKSLLQTLAYSSADERENAPARHKVVINGNIRNGSSTLRQAVRRYMEFCAEPKKPQIIEPIENYL